MSDIYCTIADHVSATMRNDRCDFNAAFACVMQNHKHLDWTTTRREVGSILGKRKKRKSRLIKIPKQFELFLGRPRDEMVADATAHETELVWGIPAHDL